jgi:hypothetical protein
VRYQSGARPVDSNLAILSMIPALFLAGGEDTMSNPADAKRLWRWGRAGAAPWTFALDPNGTHGDHGDYERANELLIPWVDAVLKLRLPSEGTTLRAVTDATGWLGDHSSGTTMPSSTFARTRMEASWLPDEVTARVWERGLWK